MNKGIIFDLDGTLWDARSTLLDSYNFTMKKYKLNYSFDFDMVTSFMGLTPQETVLKVFKDVDFAIGMKYFSYLVKEELVYLKKYPGKIFQDEIEVLDKLSKKYNLFIVSNCESGYIETYLEGCKTSSYFVDHLCIGDTKKEKNENIKLIIQKHNLDKAIYVGDTIKDYVETTKAGIPFVHARYGFGVVDDAKYYINNLIELEEIVSKII